MIRSQLKIISLVTTGILLAANTVLAKGINDSIIAIVNSDAITLKDLRSYIAGIYAQLRIENRSPQEIQEIMATYEEKGINQLIEDRLILAAANEKGLEIRPDAIDKRYKEIRDRYPTEDEFLAVLNTQGITIGDLKRKLMDQMKAKYTVDMEVRQKIFINPQDVTRYYDEHVNEFERKTRLNLQSIYISFDKGRQEARTRAGEARAKMISGTVDFDAIAKEYSEAPSVGTIEQGQMVPDIEEPLFKLKLEEVSDLIEVEGGVYVFKVVGISPGKQQSIKEVKNQVYNKLFDEQFQLKFREWIEKLRKKAYVEIKE